MDVCGDRMDHVDDEKKAEMAEGEKEGIVLPPEIISHIVSFLDCDALNKMRLVSRDLNDSCKRLLISKARNLFNAYLHVSYAFVNVANTQMLDVIPAPPFHGCFIKACVALLIIKCLGKVMAALAVPAEDDKSSFDAGKVIEDAARLLDRLKTEEELPYSLEEIIPHSFLLFKTFCEKRSDTAISYKFNYLERILEKNLRKEAAPVEN